VTSADASSIIAGRVAAIAGGFFRFRATLVPPAALLAWIVAMAHGAPRSQLVALATGMTVTSLFFVYEARRAERPMSENRFAVSLSVTIVALGAATLITGGITSPMLPLLFAPTITAFAAFARRRASLAILVSFVCIVIALFALGDRTPFSPLAIEARVALTALFSLVTAALLWSSVAGLADGYTRAAAEVASLREDTVARVLERSRVLDAVGAKVAHEIKNPLAAIKGLAQLSRRQATDEQSERRLAVIEREVERIEAVLRDYLTFARPFDALEREPVAIDALVERVLAALEPRAQRAEVTLQYKSRCSTVIQGDRRKLESSLINVGINAIEASPRGASVTFESAQHEVERVLVTVHDEGPALSAATLARIGTPFFTTRSDGTGLGVAIARGAVEQHGGTLELSCPERGGTTVTITLPNTEAISA
jgi:signal transduction histidine kinase